MNSKTFISSALIVLSQHFSSAVFAEELPTRDAGIDAAIEAGGDLIKNKIASDVGAAAIEQFGEGAIKKYVPSVLRNSRGSPIQLFFQVLLGSEPAGGGDSLWEWEDRMREQGLVPGGFEPTSNLKYHRQVELLKELRKRESHAAARRANLAGKSYIHSDPGLDREISYREYLASKEKETSRMIGKVSEVPSIADRPTSQAGVAKKESNVSCGERPAYPRISDYYVEEVINGAIKGRYTKTPSEFIPEYMSKMEAWGECMAGIGSEVFDEQLDPSAETPGNSNNLGEGGVPDSSEEASPGELPSSEFPTALLDNDRFDVPPSSTQQIWNKGASESIQKTIKPPRVWIDPCDPVRVDTKSYCAKFNSRKNSDLSNNQPSIWNRVE